MPIDYNIVKEFRMGIARSFAELLFEEAKRKPFKGSVLQLGRQDTYFNYEDLKKYAKQKDFNLSPNIKPTYIKNPWINLDCIDDQTFFLSIGFSQVESCDASAYEMPTFVFDLNKDIPNDLEARYDVIIDSGTIEHVFHIPNVLRNIHQMLKPGGRIIHSSPTSNFVDHGFYMFSPTFFFDYYGANRYLVENATVFELETSHNTPWKLHKYPPGEGGNLSICGLGSSMLGTFFVATKEIDSTSGIIPTQGFYKDLWCKSSVKSIDSQNASISKQSAERSALKNKYKQLVGSRFYDVSRKLLKPTYPVIKWVISFFGARS